MVPTGKYESMRDADGTLSGSGRIDVVRSGDEGAPLALALYDAIAAQELFASVLREELGLSIHERLVLVHLLNGGPMSMSAISRRMALSPGAITGLADRLERMGYVQRVSDPNDRRRNVLVLTEALIADFGRVSNSLIDEINALADELGSDGAAAVRTFLRRATTIFEARGIHVD